MPPLWCLFALSPRQDKLGGSMPPYTFGAFSHCRPAQTNATQVCHHLAFFSLFLLCRYAKMNSAEVCRHLAFWRLSTLSPRQDEGGKSIPPFNVLLVNVSMYSHLQTYATILILTSSPKFFYVLHGFVNDRRKTRLFVRLQLTFFLHHDFFPPTFDLAFVVF